MSFGIIRSLKQQLWLSLALLGLLVALGILYRFPPATHSFYPKCIFHLGTGLHCPGCGGLRATHHLVHGRFLEAIRMNALATIMLPTLAIVLLAQRFLWKNSHSLWHLTASSKVYWSIFSVIVAFWILRNIPFVPFVWLAPH